MTHKRTEIKNDLLVIFRNAVKDLTFQGRSDQADPSEKTVFWDQPHRRPTEQPGRPLFSLQIPSEEPDEWGSILATETRAFNLVITCTLFDPARVNVSQSIGPDYLAEVGVLLESILMAPSPPLSSIHNIEFGGYEYQFMDDATEQEIQSGTWQFRVIYSLPRGHAE